MALVFRALYRSALVGDMSEFDDTKKYKVNFTCNVCKKGWSVTTSIRPTALMPVCKCGERKDIKVNWGVVR